MAFSRPKRKRNSAFCSPHTAPTPRVSRPRSNIVAGPQTHSTGLRSRTTTDVDDDERAREDTEQEFDEDLDRVVMAVDIRDNGTVGCCYYVAREEKIYLFSDAHVADMTIIETIKLEVKPTVLLASTRADQLVNERQGGNSDRENTQFNYPWQVDIRPSPEFNYTNARIKLAALETLLEKDESIRFLVPGDGLSYDDQVDADEVGFTAQEGKLLRLTGCIDLENTISVGCAGAVLTYLQRRRATEYLPSDPEVNRLSVRSIEMFTLKGTMFINIDTLSSLQILQSESHPNAFNQGPGRTSSGSKEGLSIYGLFHHLARTPQGKARLRQLFLRPSIDLDTINSRHRFITVSVRPDNSPALEKMVSALKKIKNLHPVMINLRKGVSIGGGKVTGFKTTVWATLLAFAFYGIDIQEALREIIGGESLALRTKALEILNAAELRKVGRIIHEIVDIDSSEEQHRTVVKPGIDRELDTLKDRYNGLDSLLKQVAIDVAMTVPEELDIDVNVIYFPQLGFNIAIPLTEDGIASYNGDEEEWEQMFVTENRAYFKDFRMREMDDKLGDIYGLICEKEIEIVYELAQKVLHFEQALLKASDICGELDSLLAMAQGAILYKLVCPRMRNENVIKVKGGRHLLQELTVPSYVPNDTFIIGGSGSNELSEINAPSLEATHSREVYQGPSMLLLTGPNYSGKSVYMKQVALIVYLAHIGSFVPAESAEIGITDKILTRVTTRETVSKGQSAFMIDLQQMSLALKMATNRSLLIIDEFGKGTDWSDGAGLVCGVLEYLLDLNDNRPKVLAATHFHEIFENRLLVARPELQFGHMEVQIDERSKRSGNQITYLYNFVLGRSSESFGTICAAMNGIPPAIVDRANEIAALSARGENLVAVCAKMSAEETAALEEAEVIARNFVQLSFSNGNERSSGSASARDLLDALLERASRNRSEG
ncbi:hypothetical protein DTO166G4_6043 [Paecilomyces variotii]|nr:hypothetical protein DTO166G4_6043 [Paecilomyces variotii]KAJ9241143.1 hypothetical protein DTO166G5_1305 [Paecilomyces variotii]KAJ9308046.1 hypothetical protein DTO217A2_2540 [Paecilomyces variotii]